MNVYLDYAATTPLDSEILDHMLPYFKGEFGNPDSAHAYGRRTAYAVSQARDRIARVLNVQPGEVYFTSGGTEADNWAARRLGKEAFAFRQSNITRFCRARNCARAALRSRRRTSREL